MIKIVERLSCSGYNFVTQQHNKIRINKPRNIQRLKFNFEQM